ncbi:M42 family metallopeptidase [Brevibacillus laterosporus]|uniref:M42 family metallopeptidase n=1 Tax=Brevibacillus laterosporus TaxID=1465 RepID=UPI0018CDFC9E|nr:M42 family metallopeptidase [Brevibacillus laterosporus]MBG9799393.1 peptidase M42 [Brevibacillus laterosporus]MCR8938287.1 M42 family metallopeptidase [Brevibacillus laterosporus]MCZ0840927.1 M42 family metallopeptidase [Brevibacillus laterosporus]MCZ0845476.1 M42 family metallopeptidase [Brevibacillus laterosporus]MED1909426.1 M42 family metallopeptidase [Brevibacillus laterosporus]
MNLSLSYMIDTFVKLAQIPSPSGNTNQVISWVSEELSKSGVHVERTNKGALLATLSGRNNDKHRLLTAHVDTLGAMVKEIKSNGRLKLSMVGGFAWNAIEGEHCQIETATGRIYTGTILTSKASVHVYRDSGKAERTEDLMEVRLDEKVTDAQEVKALGISVGDFVSFDPRTTVTESGFVKSRHLDDKASVAILLGIIKAVQEDKLELPYTTHFLISNNEEIGYGGNSSIPVDTVEYLAVDMGAIGTGQTTDEYCVSICAKDSSGPYHYGFRKKLVALADKNGLNYQVDIYPYYGSDASAALRAGYDIVHGLIGPGVDASHSHERTHSSAFDNTAKLIMAYILSDELVI